MLIAAGDSAPILDLVDDNVSTVSFAWQKTVARSQSFCFNEAEELQICRFSYKKMDKNMAKENKDDSPAIRKRPLKLSRLRLLEVTKAPSLVLQPSPTPFPNHFLEILSMASSSFSFKIALETSGVSGEPFGNT